MYSNKLFSISINELAINKKNYIIFIFQTNDVGLLPRLRREYFGKTHI